MVYYKVVGTFLKVRELWHGKVAWGLIASE